MTKTAEALNGDRVAVDNVHLADGVEDGDTGAEEGSGFGGVELFGNGDGGLGAESGVFSISTVPGDAVDLLVVAGLEESTVASLADTVVTSVPATTNAVSNLPLLLSRGNSDDGSNDFVAGNSGAAIVRNCSVFKF